MKDTLMTPHITIDGIANGGKKHGCTYCQYTASNKGHLAEHMRAHSGEKPFSCNVCQFKFVRESHLKRHMKTHTGEKPFSCTVCEYKSSRKRSFNTTHENTYRGKTFLL